MNPSIVMSKDADIFTPAIRGYFTTAHFNPIMEKLDRHVEVFTDSRVNGLLHHLNDACSGLFKHFQAFIKHCYTYYGTMGAGYTGWDTRGKGSNRHTELLSCNIKYNSYITSYNVTEWKKEMIASKLHNATFVVFCRYTYIIAHIQQNVTIII